MKRFLFGVFLCFCSIGVQAQFYSFNDLLITEIMARPSDRTQLPDSEYAEIHNHGTTAISLLNFTFSDATRTVPLPDVTIEAGEYLLLVPATRLDLWEDYTDFKIIPLSPWPTLNVGGDDLSLKGPNGELVFTISYSDTWYRDNIKADGGYSLEMIDLNFPCVEQANWRASDDLSGGTPGRENSVLAENPDTEGPILQRVALDNSNQLRLIFNEKLDPTSALNASIQIEPMLAIESIGIVEPSMREVIVRLNEEAIEGIYYSIQVNGITDCSGNLLHETVNSANFGLPSPATPLDVVINEILPNPRTGGAKFVEIYNASEKILNLQNWRLANANSAGDADNFRTITSDVFLFSPQEYLVFTDDSSVLAIEYPKGKSERFLQMSLPSYPQSGGSVILIDDNVTILDQLNYDEDLHHPLVKDYKGVSLERISVNTPTESRENWTSGVQSEGYATPGYQNAQRLQVDGIADNFSIEPKSFAPDDPGTPNFATISYQFANQGNVANITIFDVLGREIKKVAQNELLGTEGFFTWDGTDQTGRKARIGYYIVLFEIYDMEGRLRSFKETIVVATRF
ncbi:lamin tail domain-containing protein [Fulvivirgaceae bacterium LMO-SS25]